MNQSISTVGKATTNKPIYVNVNKKKSTGKVDEVVALINAMYLLQQYLLNDDSFVAQTA